MSEAESSFVVDGLVQGLRNDGRTLTAFRGFSMTFDVIPQANSSVRIFRETDLDLTIGVKCELSEESELRVNIEQHPDLEPIIREYVANKFDLTSQWPVPWNVNIDVLVSKSNGALIDMIVAGIYAALGKLKVPRCAVLVDEGKKKVFMDDKVENFLALDVFSGLPLALSFGIVGEGLLFVDPDALEEQILKTHGSGVLVTVFGKEDGICGIRKFGKGLMDPGYLKSLTEVASGLLTELRKALQRKLL